MNRTTHYNLVLFESADKPTWLENWNETMSHIDEVLYRISSGGGDLPDLSEVVARLEVLESQMSSANLQIQQNANNITAMQSSIETINTTLAGLADADTSLESEISGINSTISNIQTSIGTISQQLSNLQENITNISSRIDNIENKTSVFTTLSLYDTSALDNPHIMNFKKGDVLITNRTLNIPELEIISDAGNTVALCLDNNVFNKIEKYGWVTNDMIAYIVLEDFTSELSSVEQFRLESLNCISQKHVYYPRYSQLSSNQYKGKLIGVAYSFPIGTLYHGIPKFPTSNNTNGEDLLKIHNECLITENIKINNGDVNIYNCY